MPIQITCASCGQKLRVDDIAIGKKVACPRCKQTFVAEEEVVEAIMEEPAKPAAPIVIPGSPSDDGYELVDDEAPRGKKTEAPNEDEELRRRPKKRRSVSGVRAMVSHPATALQIVAYIGAALTFLMQLARVGMMLAALGRDGPPAPGMGPPASPGATMGGMVCGLVISVALLALWAKILLHTADCMHCLDQYTWAVLGCFAAIVLPCGVGWLGGIPIGIWGARRPRSPRGARCLQGRTQQ
jgi:hypothetical protein